MTSEPNLLQVSIWKNNLGLISEMLEGLDMMDNLNFTLDNEHDGKETQVDWIDRQIDVAQPAVKTRLKKIRLTLVTEYNAKTLEVLKASGMCVAPQIKAKID